MSESPSTQGQAASLVARFDAARDTFLAAFAQAPDEALPYTPAGEEYALGVLPIHLQDSMNHYLDVYQRVSRRELRAGGSGRRPHACRAGGRAASAADRDQAHGRGSGRDARRPRTRPIGVLTERFARTRRRGGDTPGRCCLFAGNRALSHVGRRYLWLADRPLRRTRRADRAVDRAVAVGAGAVGADMESVCALLHVGVRAAAWWPRRLPRPFAVV